MVENPSAITKAAFSNASGKRGKQMAPMTVQEMETTPTSMKVRSVAVVVPCYKVRQHIEELFAAFGPEVAAIYAVDDACPDKSGQFIEESVRDSRVTVLYNDVNTGVGGAVLHGLQQAFADGHSIGVKIDGDGQMDPSLIHQFVDPIQTGLADYTKGNRFFIPQHLRDMPLGRLIGNAILSFVNKLSTGYWNVFDPTNGYIALDLRLMPYLETEKISKRYFFESDLLFRAGLARARVLDVPMVAIYADEVSHLDAKREASRFMKGHLRNFIKRIGYDYFLRDFSVASLELVFGCILMVFGVVFGSVNMGGAEAASAGTVMLSALPLLTGILLLLSFINYDIQKTPSVPLATRLPTGAGVDHRV